MSELGIVIISHSHKIAEGLSELLAEVAKDVAITYGGGLEDGSIGTTFEDVQAIVEANTSTRLLAFYDLGSAGMNLEMVQDFTEKELIIPHVPLIEGAYTAAALIQAGMNLEAIQAQLKELVITK